MNDKEINPAIYILIINKKNINRKLGKGMNIWRTEKERKIKHYVTSIIIKNLNVTINNISFSELRLAKICNKSVNINILNIYMTIL